MIFRIMGHVYDINIQTATAFWSESFNMTERQRRNACWREACVLIIVRTERGIPYSCWPSSPDQAAVANRIPNYMPTHASNLEDSL